MTEEIDNEEEIIENTEQLPTDDAETMVPQTPVISSPSQVEPMSSTALFEHALLLLQASADDENSAAYIDNLYSEYFGENYTPEDLNTPVTDERQQHVISDYIIDRLDYAKTLSTNLNKAKIDKAFESMFSLVGMNITIGNSVEELYDEIFAKRASLNPFLLEDYEMLKLNRQAWHVYNDKTNITELSGIITAMEDLEINVDGAKSQYKVVSKENLAQFYYNSSEIYESEANRKSNMPDVNKWHYRAMEYKKKALDTTSLNVVMVSNIQKDWKEYSDYNPQKIIDACERIIGNPNAGDRDKFRAHRLYANTLIDQHKIDGYFGRDERFDSAIKQFRNALAYVCDVDDKINILDSISKAQKYTHPQDFISTRLEIAEILEGRPRMREYVKLADFTKDKNLKMTLLKSCINEFHELDEIDIEDRILYEDVDCKLRKITPADDVKTIKILNKLKKDFGLEETKSNELLFPMMSSKGHDYFNK